MRDRLSKLNQTWQQQGLPTVQMRVGIYTGSVTVGSLGGTHRLEYGVIGDSVNIASRLESYEKHRHVGICRILIAQETLTHLQGKVNVNSWGNLTLKGKQKQVDVFEVLDKA
jgi:adenylate cyclase